MATFMLIHGAGDTGWYWHLTEAELRLGAVPDEVPGCHCAALSHPRQLSDLLASYLD